MRTIKTIFWALRAAPYVLFLAVGIMFAMVFFAGFKIADAFDFEARPCDNQ